MTAVALAVVHPAIWRAHARVSREKQSIGGDTVAERMFAVAGEVVEILHFPHTPLVELVPLARRHVRVLDDPALHLACRRFGQPNLSVSMWRLR